jgi:hypothetical protein
MITEVFIEGQRLDISADLSSLLTFAIDDVKDFASRQTTFSKTIVLPGTANNNAIFGNIFETGISNDYNPLLNNIGYNFNAAKSAACIIFQDNLQTFKGTIRLLEIIKDHGNIEYEAAMNGEITSLSVALSSGFLTDLDFSSHNMVYNETNIVASWDSAPGNGVYFPLIDYGQYSQDKHHWDIKTFRPALYVKEYIDKIFTAAKFRYSSVLFNTDRFKRLVVPHNQKQLNKLTGNILTGNSSTPSHIIDHTASVNNGNVFFASIFGGLFTNVGGKVFTYTGATTLTTMLTVHLDGYFNFKKTVPPSISDFNCSISIQKNGVDYYFDGLPITDDSGFDAFYVKNFNVALTLATGDTFQVYYILRGGPAGPADVYVNNATIGVTTGSPVTSPLDYGELIELKYSIPQNIRQVDFLLSVVKLFNLYVYESQFDDRLIYITPFVDFYSTNSSNAVDWTYKLNRNEVIKVKPLSELNSKIYKFNYRDDADYFNDLYKKRYNQGYGSYIYDSKFEFASQTNDLQLIFAATAMVGYTGQDKVYSTILKQSNQVEEQLDSVIRILQTKKVTGVTSWNMVNNNGTIYGSYTKYGYAGHFDDPDNVGNDLNFGQLNELFFVLVTGDLTKTQFNIYWSAYMAEITDKDSKMLTAKFHLTPMDIFNLDFSKYVVVDNVLFRLNKITDYNVTVPSDCEVELLKVINTIY